MSDDLLGHVERPHYLCAAMTGLRQGELIGGAPLRAIQEWMGHADASTTEIYAHYAPDPTGGAALVEKAFGAPGSSAALNRVTGN